MAQRWHYVAIALSLLLAMGAFMPPQAYAQVLTGPTPQPSPNYYASPGGEGGVTAALYPSPRPVPPLVGHTYITYEPLAPHEFLYEHHRVYKRDFPDGSRTRTRVKWNHTLTLGPSVMHSVPALHLPPAVGSSAFVP